MSYREKRIFALILMTLGLCALLYIGYVDIVQVNAVHDVNYFITYVVNAVMLAIVANAYVALSICKEKQDSFLDEFFTQEELQQACDKRLRDLAVIMKGAYEAETAATIALEREPGKLDKQAAMIGAEETVRVVKQGRDKIYRLVRFVKCEIEPDWRVYLPQRS